MLMYKQVSIFTLGFIPVMTRNQKYQVTSQAVMNPQLKRFVFEEDGV